MSTSIPGTLHSSAPRSSTPLSSATERPVVLADHLRRHITCTDRRAPLSTPEFCQHQGSTALLPRQRQLLAVQGDGRHALTVQAFDERSEIPGQSEALTRGLPGSQQVLELPERPADVDYLSVSGRSPTLQQSGAADRAGDPGPAAGAHSCAASRAPRDRLLWDQEHGVSAPEPHRGAQLCHSPDGET